MTVAIVIVSTVLLIWFIRMGVMNADRGRTGAALYCFCVAIAVAVFMGWAVS
jgi:hypothetical protein